MDCDGADELEGDDPGDDPLDESDDELDCGAWGLSGGFGEALAEADPGDPPLSVPDEGPLDGDAAAVDANEAPRAVDGDIGRFDDDGRAALDVDWPSASMA